ncbi:MAG: T9SS type A sorting domain-containing protein [Saprospiraceae bacterium]|jgi:ELWxxDGT repeat protein|nr:T9SS type A sorting domain-containing protein [Saprospiraceae bacterium]
MEKTRIQYRKFLSLVVSALLLCGSAGAQRMIMDFIPGQNTYTSVEAIGPAGDPVAFLNASGNLWKTDGTCEGTVLVKDFNQSGYPTNFMRVGTLVFFTANNTTNGRELWATNGTEAGTYLVKDIYAGSNGSAPDDFCRKGSILYFTAITSANGRELWRSDGTGSGTYLVSDIRPGTNSSAPGSLTVFKDTLFFSATTTIGECLWKSDGTAAGTSLVYDMVPGSTAGGIGYMAVASGQLFFSGSDNTHGSELWVTDGSTAGTKMVRDINPGTASGLPYEPFHTFGNVLFFIGNDGTHGNELWRSTGSEASTVLVKDMNPGANGSSIDYFAGTSDALFFQASDGTHGSELWRSNGTDANTYMVRDIYTAPNAGSSPRYLTVLGDRVYFSAYDDMHGYELWSSDGTFANTELVGDIEPGATGSNPNNLVATDDEVLFVAKTALAGIELYSSAPPPSGPPVDAEVVAITNPKCRGEAKGAIDINVTQGNCPFVFQWQGPYSYQKYYSEDLSSVWAGTYSVTITDAKGSTKALSVTITEPEFLLMQIASNDPPDCQGNLGELTVKGTGGVQPYQFVWSNGVQGPTQSNIPFPGANYTVTVTDANNCTRAGEFSSYAETVHIPPLKVNHPISCYNDIAYIYYEEGVKPATPTEALLQWVAGAGGEILSDPNQLEIVVRGAATYYLTATASTSGCTDTDSVIVTSDMLHPLADAGPDLQLNCSTDTVVLQSVVSPNGSDHPKLDIRWEALQGGHLVSSRFETTPTVDRPGKYVLTVQSQFNGCIARDTVDITSATDGPEISISGDPTFCQGDVVTLTAVLDTTKATFEGWYVENGLYSTELTMSMPENEGWGFVIARAGNQDGCVRDLRVDLLRNNQPSFLTLSADSCGCGGVPIKVAGYFPYENMSWQWAGPNGFIYNGPEPHVYQPGPYYVTVTIGNCTIQDAITVVGNSSLQITGYSITPPYCPKEASGQIWIYSVSGGWTHEYLWSNGSVGSSAYGLTGGDYWVGITGTSYSGGKSCYLHQTFHVPEPDSITITMEVALDSTGGSNASITAVVTGLPVPEAYYWSNGETTPTITGLAPGIYTVTVTFSNWCTATATAEVAYAGCTLELVETGHVDNSCPGEATGSVTIEVRNGENPVELLWSNGAQTTEPTNLAEGIYTVTATDARGCTATLEVEIFTIDTTPPVLQLAELTRSLDAAGQLVLTAQDFDAGSFDNCVLVSFVAEPVEFGCADLGVRIITVTATDNSGNVTTGEVPLIVQDLVPPAVICPEHISVGFCQRTVTFSLPQVNDEVCVAFDPNRMTQLEGLPSGAEFPVGTTLQMFRYTKLNGLSADCEFTVTVAPALLLEISQVINDTNSTGVGAINITVSGGTPPYTFAWFLGTMAVGQTEDLANLFAGKYHCVVTDANGCPLESTEIVVDNVVGANEPDWAQGLVIAPNPGSDVVRVRFNRPLSNPPLCQILDLGGRAVEAELREWNAGQIEFSVRSLPAGVYLVQLKVDQTAVTRRLVVVK